jgi:hypothetical protein
LELDLNLQQELIRAIAAFNGERAWYESSAAIALASGLVAILGGLLSHLFSYLSEQQRQKASSALIKLESEIRKQENIQEKQLDALMALAEINHELSPTIWSGPDYDSHEAYSEVVFSMGSLLGKLDKFLKEYSYIMPNEIITLVNVVMFKCNERHWGASTAETPDYQPNESEIEAAETVLKFLHESVAQFKKILGVSNA